MPVAPTYPGVYIQEIPSGVRTIAGVATSITAFIGRALRGPVHEPVTINNFGDFERIFGGLWAESGLSYAVRDFYLNGGSQAVIVRIFAPYFADEGERVKAQGAAQAVAEVIRNASVTDTRQIADQGRSKADSYTDEPERTAAALIATAAETAATLEGATPESVLAAAEDAQESAAPLNRAQLDMDSLRLEAAEAGAWGNNLRARVDYDVKGGATNLFNLAIRDGNTGQIEYFRNLSVVVDHPRQAERTLLNESRLVRVRGGLPLARPVASTPAPSGTDAWGDNTAPTNSKVSARSSDGLVPKASSYTGDESLKQGLYALEYVDLFNMLCIPPAQPGGDIDVAVIATAAAYCERRRAMLLIDAPSSWSDTAAAQKGIDEGVGTSSKNAAIFFPRLRQPNPLRDNQIEVFAPCGAVAGVFARTDSQRGIWKAPAGLEATLVGVPGLSVALTDAENGALNPLGINCLRAMPAVGRVIWGARTLQGDDRLASEWKYIPVRRLALYIEESLYRGMQWVVFEPNDEPLWSQIRLNVGAFMQGLFRQGAFQGQTPRQAYFVKCDRETSPQSDIDKGIVNLVVGFAPLKPAEFVIISLQQIAGQTQA